MVFFNSPSTAALSAAGATAVFAALAGLFPKLAALLAGGAPHDVNISVPTIKIVIAKNRFLMFVLLLEKMHF
jgi:hypothetical protein